VPSNSGPLARCGYFGDLIGHDGWALALEGLGCPFDVKNTDGWAIAAEAFDGNLPKGRWTNKPVCPLVWEHENDSIIADSDRLEFLNTDRALFWAEPNFIPLRDPEWQPLRDARRSREVADDTPVLVFEVAGRTLTLVSSQMAYHHVAQGEMSGEPWMVTF